MGHLKLYLSYHFFYIETPAWLVSILSPDPLACCFYQFSICLCRSASSLHFSLSAQEKNLSLYFSLLAWNQLRLDLCVDVCFLMSHCYNRMCSFSCFVKEVYGRIKRDNKRHLIKDISWPKHANFTCLWNWKTKHPKCLLQPWNLTYININVTINIFQLQRHFNGVFYTVLFFDRRLDSKLWLRAHMKSISATLRNHIVRLKSDIALFPADVYYSLNI